MVCCGSWCMVWSVVGSETHLIVWCDGLIRWSDLWRILWAADGVWFRGLIWRTLKIWLRRMVSSDGWKLERWDAEEIVGIRLRRATYRKTKENYGNTLFFNFGCNWKLSYPEKVCKDSVKLIQGCADDLRIFSFCSIDCKLQCSSSYLLNRQLSNNINRFSIPIFILGKGCPSREGK